MNSLRILLGAIFLLTLLPVQAGVVSKVDASDTQIEKDKEVSLTFKFADSPSAIACGLSIDWGDGKIERFRLGEGQQIPPPYKINHLYSLPNNYKVRINGELLVRGLRSVPACDVKQEGTITVYDPVEVARKAQEKAEAEKEQQARIEAEAIVRKDREEAARVAAIAKAAKDAKDAEERAKQQVEIAKKNPTATQQSQSSPKSTGIDPLFAKGGLWVSNDVANRSGLRCVDVLANQNIVSFEKYEPYLMTLYFRVGGKHPFKDNPDVKREINKDISVRIEYQGVKSNGDLISFTRLVMKGNAVISKNYELNLNKKNIRLVKNISCYNCGDLDLRLFNNGEMEKNWCTEG